MSIPLSPPQATALPSPLRNQIYSALLSNGSIRAIEATLTQLLQSSGFQAHLRAYITDLFRTGQATTAQDAFVLAMARVRACMAEGGEDDAASAVNGVNGVNAGEEVDLRLPDVVVREGSKVVRRELERVVDIDMD